MENTSAVSNLDTAITLMYTILEASISYSPYNNFIGCPNSVVALLISDLQNTTYNMSNIATLNKYRRVKFFQYTVGNYNTSGSTS